MSSYIFTVAIRPHQKTAAPQWVEVTNRSFAEGHPTRHPPPVYFGERATKPQKHTPHICDDVISSYHMLVIVMQQFAVDYVAFLRGCDVLPACHSRRS